MIRGGDWSNFAPLCRCANRFVFVPAFRSNRIGFRVALTTDAPRRELPLTAPGAVEATSANSNATTSTPAAVPTKTLDRLVAEQVISLGGQVGWFIGGGGERATKTSELPKHSFKVRAIALGISEVPLELLRGAGQLRHLQDLNFTGGGIGDQQLEPLSNLHSLRTLGLADTKVTDVGLRTLTSLNELSP